MTKVIEKKGQSVSELAYTKPGLCPKHVFRFVEDYLKNVLCLISKYFSTYPVKSLKKTATNVQSLFHDSLSQNNLLKILQNIFEDKNHSSLQCSDKCSNYHLQNFFKLTSGPLVFTRSGDNPHPFFNEGRKILNT